MMNKFDPHLRFPGTLNFRDMGGHQTAGGGRVRSRRLFRSGHLADTEPSSQSDIATLGISLVCDFRIEDERNEQPNQYHVNWKPKFAHLPIWPVVTPGIDNTVARLMSGEIDIDGAMKDQTGAYREFVRERNSQFAGMFTAILDAEHPSILLHCSAGKDRTGIAAALLLTALGVEPVDVRRDYLLTSEGHGARAQTQFYIDKYWAAYKNEPSCTQEDLHRLFSVQSEKIDAAFDEMRTISGSIEHYLGDALALTDNSIAELKRRYVTPL